jgi:ankyrin repeat protein
MIRCAVLPKFIEHINPGVLQILIENGVVLNRSLEWQGRTPLMYAACKNSNPDVIQVLIENGADVNAVDENGWTPLKWATENNENPEILRVLIENGAVVDTKVREGKSASEG